MQIFKNKVGMAILSDKVDFRKKKMIPPLFVLPSLVLIEILCNSILSSLLDCQLYFLKNFWWLPQSFQYTFLTKSPSSNNTIPLYLQCRCIITESYRIFSPIPRDLAVIYFTYLYAIVNQYIVIIITQLYFRSIKNQKYKTF